MSKRPRLSVWLALFLSLVWAPAAAGAQPAAGSASTEPASESSLSPTDPRIAQLRALIQGKLSTDVEPSSLFDIPLDDDAAIDVEAARIRVLLQTASADGGSKLDAGATQTSALYAQRLALDRARLAFYALGPERRVELLREQRARQDALRPAETEAERRAHQAAAERQRTLEAARVARSEAEWAVAEEHKRLIALGAQLDKLIFDLEQQRQELSTSREEILGWKQRARESKVAGAASSDETYDALRVDLRASRSELAQALDALDAEASQVPELPSRTLVEVRKDVPTEQLQTLRAQLAQRIVQARVLERSVRGERAATLLEKVTSLNGERLALLPFLSARKRDATTGFTAAGWDQAESEARHLTLILRYERHVTQALIAAWRDGDAVRSRPSLWRVAFMLVPWIVLIGAFVWGNRRVIVLLRLVDMRLAALDRTERRTTPSPPRRAVRLLSQLRLPIEWSLFLGASMWLLPTEARELLEVQLLSTILIWVIGMSFVVNGINALASAMKGVAWHEEDIALNALRLRSLRLVGRTVVVFALILMLSQRLVGAGTIYSWVWSTCWLASLPIFVVLVRWWRGLVFGRVERIRKKTPLQNWALARRSGWQSFFAAMLMALQLFAAGAYKIARGWLSEFDLARRAHAYFFKRELERLGDVGVEEASEPLSDSMRSALDPEAPYATWLSCANDAVLDELAARSGGLHALVGSRGMGKSSLLRALATRLPGALVIACDASTTPEVVLRALEQAGPEVPAVLLDDAHTLVKPVIGGFAVFDDMIARSREHCRRTLWVWALDATLWPLLKRARDARPLFDETHSLAPWEETQIGALLAERCKRAGIVSTYEDLVEKLPPGADEIDRQDAAHEKQLGYERMLWDHVRGNPALALEAWRSSLACDRRGIVHVRPLHVPDASTLDVLPDSALFVLRAVLQLGPAAIADVAEATRLNPEQVLNVLRFGQALGVFSEHEGRVRISWAFLRAVMRLLERRHLLVSP